MNQKPKSDKRIVSNTEPLGIDTNTEFHNSVPVHDHGSSKSLQKIIKEYDTDANNNITLGNVSYKAEAAMDVLHKTPAVLIETEPWFVKQNMGTGAYDRWEPFVVAFPERTVNDTHMLFTNLAPLSEVAHQLSKRDIQLEKASDNNKSTENVSTAAIQAQKHEQLAFTRYELECCYNGETNPDDASTNGELIHEEIVEGIHTCLSPWPQHLIVGAKDNGTLYCGRGSLFDEHVDVAIGLDRRIRKGKERKVALYNDRSTKDIIQRLDFDQTYRKYLGNKKRWEANMDAIEYIITELLIQDEVEYVSLHRSTEKAYTTHINPSFKGEIEGYPGFKQ